MSDTERDSPTIGARRDCSVWLVACLELGWSRDAIDGLEDLWWTHHDNLGRMRTTAVVSTPAADQQTELEAVNELTKDWQWTVISPDGRQWIGETAFRAASKAHRETITPEQAANVLATLQSEQARADAEMVAEHEHLNCPACGGSGHVDDVPASLAACFAGGSPARDVEVPAAINQESDGGLIEGEGV